MDLIGTLLRVNNLTYRYSSQDRNLLEKVSFTIGLRDKWKRNEILPRKL